MEETCDALERGAPSSRLSPRLSTAPLLAATTFEEATTRKADALVGRGFGLSSARVGGATLTAGFECGAGGVAGIPRCVDASLRESLESEALL